jgi:hypothetical protein
MAPGIFDSIFNMALFPNFNGLGTFLKVENTGSFIELKLSKRITFMIQSTIWKNSIIKTQKETIHEHWA